MLRRSPAPVDPLRALLGLAALLWAAGMLFSLVRLLHGWWQHRPAATAAATGDGGRVQAVFGGSSPHA